MNAYEWLLSTFMLMSVLLTPYAPVEMLTVVAPTITATHIDNSSHSNHGKETKPWRLKKIKN
jgi:hypothetical protein